MLEQEPELLLLLRLIKQQLWYLAANILMPCQNQHTDLYEEEEEELLDLEKVRHKA